MSLKTPKKSATRDTAKDIILGLQPSGKGPRKPKEGIAQTPPRKVRSTTPSRTPSRRTTSEPNLSRQSSTAKSNRSTAQTIVVPKQDTALINSLQNQLQQLKKQHNDLAYSEQASRKRLEAAQEALNKKLLTSASGDVHSSRALDDIRRQLVQLEAKQGMIHQDVGAIKGTVDRHTNDIMGLSSEVKNRPTVDPSKLTSTQQQVDMRLRDLHNQLTQLKQQMDAEVQDRTRGSVQNNDAINRLNEYIRQQEQQKNNMMAQLSSKGDTDKIQEETRRLNDKVALLSNDLNKSMMDREARLREELINKHGASAIAMKQDYESQLEKERESKRRLEERMVQMEALLVELQSTQQNDKNKNKEKFVKVNEALAALEHHLELGNKKMDKILNAEIQSRKLHEKGLLSKVNDLDDRLQNYLAGLNKSVEDAKAGKENIKVPTLDTDALRREMEAISADKNKMSMEGLLKLEEKISRIQQGLNRDRRQMTDALSDMNGKDQITKLKIQLSKLDDVIDDVEKTQDRVRDKVERQIPQDLNELSAKVDNLKQQLTQKMDQEEEERYLAIKELQDAYNKLTAKPVKNDMAEMNGTNPTLQRDIDECKVAIKKLAESITTVKNVLDKKINDEVRKREQDVESLEKKVRNPYGNRPPPNRYPPQVPPAQQTQPSVPPEAT